MHTVIFIFILVDRDLITDTTDTCKSKIVNIHSLIFNLMGTHIYLSLPTPIVEGMMYVECQNVTHTHTHR